MFTRRHLVILAIVAAASGAVGYINTLHHPFVYDDRTEVLDNPSIRQLSNLPAVLRYNRTRPVTNLSYAVDYASSGLNSSGYHLTNLLLHVINILLLFALVRSIVADRATPRSSAADTAAFTAFTTAILFAVHPLLTEAVGYVTGRAELLSTALVLASLHGFRRFIAAGGLLPLIAGVVTWILALGAKETAVVVPFVLLAYDRLLIRDVQLPPDARRRARRLHVPLLGAVCIAVVARVWVYVAVENAAHAGFIWRNLLVDLDVLARYVSILAVPLSQSFVHPIAAIDSVVDFALIRAVIILGAVVAAAAVARKRGEPLATFGIIWLLVALLPGLALILLADRGQPMAERRLYLASCGFFIAVAAVVSHISHVQAGRLSARLVTTSAVVVALAASLLASTVARNRVWADPVLLWTDATEKAPATWLAHFGLAQAYQEVGDCEAAVPAYERAIALVPGNVEAYLGLTACLAELQRPAEARRVLRQAIVQVPQTTDARLSLAQLEEQAHNPAEALRLCRETLALAPATPEPERCVERNERALSGR